MISYTNSQLTLNNINWQISPTYDMRHNSFQMHKTWSDFCNSGKPQSQYIVDLFNKYIVIECYGDMLKCLDEDLDHILWQFDSFKYVHLAYPMNWRNSQWYQLQFVFYEINRKFHHNWWFTSTLLILRSSISLENFKFQKLEHNFNATTQ